MILTPSFSCRRAGSSAVKDFLEIKSWKCPDVDEAATVDEEATLIAALGNGARGSIREYVELKERNNEEERKIRQMCRKVRERGT